MATALLRPAGLYNSDSRGGGGFYNHRLSASQYLGAIYGYEQTLAYSTVGQYETQTHTIDGFYTIYLTDAFSLSVAGGPQHYSASHAPSPATTHGRPRLRPALGWQGRHSELRCRFLADRHRGRRAAGSVLFAERAGAWAVWQFSRLWNAGLNVNYRINKNATPLFELTSSGGHTFATSLSLGRTTSAHTRAALRYDRIQNRYDGIPSIANNPSSDRIMRLIFLGRSIARSAGSYVRRL